MKPRTEPRRAKLPPILEIDEEGVPVFERELGGRPRWSSDDEVTGVQLDDWPTEFDD
jgi:hypothetical protein